MKRLSVALAAMLFACLAFPAVAQEGQRAACFPFKDAIKTAFERFKEIPAFVMATSGGAVLTLTVAENGNWTLWIQATEKDMCVVATGDGFIPASEAIKSLAKPGQAI